MGNYFKSASDILSVENAAASCAANADYIASQVSASNEACSECFLNRRCLAGELDSECRRALAGVTDHPRPLQKGEHRYRQSDEFNHIYIVRSGAIKTYYLDEEGEENITGFYLPGEMFGIDGVAAGAHRYSASALDTTAVCAIDFRAFEDLFRRYPAIHRQFTGVLCGEIYVRQQPLLRSRQLNAEARLSGFLVDLAQRLSWRSKSGSEFNLPMPRRDIARYVCLAEETLSRLFRRFQEQGLLTINGRRVEQFDMDAFQALARTGSSAGTGVH